MFKIQTKEGEILLNNERVPYLRITQISQKNKTSYKIQTQNCIVAESSVDIEEKLTNFRKHYHDAEIIGDEIVEHYTYHHRKNQNFIFHFEYHYPRRDPNINQPRTKTRPTSNLDFFLE